MTRAREITFRLGLLNIGRYNDGFKLRHFEILCHFFQTNYRSALQLSAQAWINCMPDWHNYVSQCYWLVYFSSTCLYPSWSSFSGIWPVKIASAIPIIQTFKVQSFGDLGVSGARNFCDRRRTTRRAGRVRERCETPAAFTACLHSLPIIDFNVPGAQPPPPWRI